MAVRFLNATEWLESRLLQGCDYAHELLDILAGEEDARNNAAAVSDLRDCVPLEIQRSPDLWRTVEWITNRLQILDEVEDIAAEFSTGMEWQDEIEPTQADELLRAMFESDHWHLYDL